jgi:dephospho-CoA kinase
MGRVPRIAITGGMGSGKSSLLKHLSKKEEFHTINMDIFAI